MYLQSRTRLIDPENLKSKRGFDLANRVRVEGEWRGWKRKGRGKKKQLWTKSIYRKEVKSLARRRLTKKKRNLAEIAEKKRVRVTQEERLSTKHSHHQSTNKLIAKPRPWNSESNDAQEEGAGGKKNEEKTIVMVCTWKRNRSYNPSKDCQEGCQPVVDLAAKPAS